MNIKVLYGVGLVFFLLVGGLFLVYINTTDHLLVIHFDQYRGIDFLGSKTDVLGMIVLGFILAATNIVLALVFRNRVLPMRKVEEEGGGGAAHSFVRGDFFYYFVPIFNIIILGLLLISVAVIITSN